MSKRVRPRYDISALVRAVVLLTFSLLFGSLAVQRHGVERIVLGIAAALLAWSGVVLWFRGTGPGDTGHGRDGDDDD